MSSGFGHAIFLSKNYSMYKPLHVLQLISGQLNFSGIAHCCTDSAIHTRRILITYCHTRQSVTFTSFRSSYLIREVPWIDAITAVNCLMAFQLELYEFRNTGSLFYYEACRN